MPHQTLILWARKLTILAALIALVATIYAFGATTPQDALASAHVEYVPLDWSLKPAGIGPGERFRLIFLSSTKRNAASSEHRDLQHLRPEPSRGRPRQHPRPRLEIQGRRLHPSRRRPRQHRDQHQRPRSADLLGGRQQGRRRLHGLLRRLVGR